MSVNRPICCCFFSFGLILLHQLLDNIIITVNNLSFSLQNSSDAKIRVVGDTGSQYHVSLGLHHLMWDVWCRSCLLWGNVTY